jgi:hypothetical protein
MKSMRAMSLLTLANFGIAIFLLLHHIQSVEATSQATILRGSGLQIVDAHGTVRASISIQPEGPARLPDGSVEKDGRIYPETVLFRLIRPDGRPSVKIATSEQGSELTLGGGIDPTYIVIASDGGDPSLSLTNKDGRTQLIKP